MKNRLQFNRMPKLYSNRAEATEALKLYYKDSSFIPLIGEPIVVRYYDNDGNKQAILAIGKATGQTADDKINREYHIIDTAEINENLSAATFSATTALELASGASKDVANYLVILKNMIGENGIDLEDGSYFDTDDPSRCGLYKPYDESNFLAEAKSFRDADFILDAELGNTNVALGELSGVTKELSGTTKEYLDNIIEAAGLNAGAPGSYPGHDETHYIKDATSLDNADVILDGAIHELSENTEAEIAELSAGTIQLSADTEAAINALGDEIDEKLDELSAATNDNKELIEKVIESAGLDADGNYPHTHEANFIDEATSLNDADVILDTTIGELSANTMAADQALGERIEELEGHEIFGQDAIETEEDENGDTTVSLKIYANEKVLSQSNQGLRSTIKLVYVPADKKIYLNGVDDVEISHIDVDDFVKDGMLESANIIVATEADHAAHPELVVGETYIKLVFNTDAEQGGKQTPVFISAKDLVDEYKVSATSINYLTIEGYEIRANVDKEHGLAGYDGVMNISAVTDNIIEAAGLNMGQQGSYPGHDETHYIKNATNLDNADVLLDEAIWVTSGMVSGFDERISDLEEEVGGFDRRIDNLEEKTDNLSDKVRSLSAGTLQLSADTYAAIMELSGRVNDAVISGINAFSGVIETYIDEKLSGLSFDELYEYVDESVESLSGSLIEMIYDNEEVTAAALNDLNRRVKANTEAIEQNTGVTELSGAVMDFSAITENIFNEYGDDISELSSYTYNTFNELSGALESISALTDGVLTIQFNGNEQGKYSPSADTTVDIEATGADILLTGYEMASGISEDDLTIEEEDSVNEAFGKIQKQILDNEEVTSAALNDLNRRLSDIATGGSADVTALSASVVTNKAKITNLSADTANLSSATLVLSADVANCFDNADYDSNAKKIYFKHGNTVIDEIDATDFIKDGMVDNVVIGVPTAGTHSGETCLIITFNTDAGKEEIDIPVSDVFDPSTLDELSASVVSNQDKIEVLSATVINDEYVTATALNDLDLRVIELSGRTVDLSGVLTGVSMNGSAVSVSAQVADLGTVITAETELSTAMTGTGNVVGGIAVNGHEITTTMFSAASAEQVSELSATTHMLSVTVSELSASVVTNEENISILSASLIDDELVIAAALNDLNDRVHELSGRSVDLSNYYTKQQVYNKQEILDMFSASGGNPDAAISALTESLSELSAATQSISGYVYTSVENLSGAVVNNYYTKNEINNGVSAITQSLSGGLYALSGYVANIQTGNTDGITGVTMNGSAVTVQNQVANLGTVVTAQTQLSTATTGTGNVVGSITVSDHEITTTMFSAASAEQIAALSATVVGDAANLGELSASVVNNETKIGVLSATIINDEYVTATALNDLNARVIELSGRTVDLSNYYTKQEVYTKEEVDRKISSGGTFDPTQYYTTADTYSKTEINNGVSASTWNLSAATLNLSAVSLTGISVNGTPVTVTDHVAMITGILSAETPVTVVKSGNNNGNVIGTISVDNTNKHQINYTVVSAATAEQLKALSGYVATIQTGGTDGITGITMNGSAVTVQNKIANLGTVLTSFTETQLSTASTGTGNVVGNISVDNHKITTTMFSAASAQQLAELSASTSSLCAITNNLSSVTVNLSGDVVNLSAITVGFGQKVTKYAEMKNSGSIYVDKYLTIYDIHSGASAKTLTLDVQSNDTLSNMASGEVIEAQIILDNHSGENQVKIQFSTNISGATVVGTLGRFDRTIAWVDASGYGEANILLVKTGNNTYVIYVITT